ncbi:hypothetical protein COY52_09235 [Candidatus Desantisbacteria bacterium CG_4_10_14_0_8_um_filter_48_22]|uniref:Uncharacterized protein n=1 Tax=Candidatus Desantisbacteria bacterium CG_4_10_14_0_8_um_filter_48_22 TaxID=1974543 RepID=A0A2M7S7W3_9BACT|nr:MAG: hypothetical protein AUJ67_08810 [Candidatus Desantisbacteria bacterium CG1_02_49_89]PIV56742.1 MAG: hypothetical protein COS16_02990 [Candidatus Desantisbacteria bacterium CG02_land_8_20_14_3_00_49_13]PIZ15635.1 MAG: hypothetical protein COY52_09235 [Candidatus Desantisbacteria bacterium CG_4_10_14_0_8_um_filter_48_22]PJB27312.1 MAG: hypothetical protein CO111_05980 [Candidatus Desantisbacteria bacterium CG_4_9_14_3_um_filter_50_7]
MMENEGSGNGGKRLEKITGFLIFSSAIVSFIFLALLLFYGHTRHYSLCLVLFCLVSILVSASIAAEIYSRIKYENKPGGQQSGKLNIYSSTGILAMIEGWFVFGLYLVTGWQPKLAPPVWAFIVMLSMAVFIAGKLEDKAGQRGRSLPFWLLIILGAANVVPILVFFL